MIKFDGFKAVTGNKHIQQFCKLFLTDNIFPQYLNILYKYLSSSLIPSNFRRHSNNWNKIWHIFFRAWLILICKA